MATIAGIASGDARFNILVSALQYVDANVEGSDLIGALSNTHASLTVFAPTDAAFGQLAKDLGYTGSVTDEGAVTTFLVGALPADTLRDVILYHVSAGAKTLAQISALDEVSTLNGATITPDGVTLIDKEPDLINPSLVATDIHADNGIIHAIDRVLLPVDLPGNDAPTITGIVAASGAFDTNGADFDFLLQAVTAAGLAGALDDATADLTVFAPTDAAFMNLAKALGYDGTTEADGFAYLVDALTLLSKGESPIPLLADILKYHVVPESLQASQVLSSTSIATLLGASLGVSGTSLVDGEPDLADPSIIATDIQAANGVVHVIDGVLIPVDLLQSDGSDDVDFIIGDNTGENISTGRDNDLIDGNGGRDRIAAGRGDDVVLGGNGGDFIFAGAGDDTVSGGNGDDGLAGGDGKDVVNGGAGFDLISGGQGKDVFVFTAGNDRDVIADFRNGSDKIDVSALGITDFADLDITGLRGRTVIDFGEGDRIVLLGVNEARLDATDFLFA
jgi:serralysin